MCAVIAEQLFWIYHNKHDFPYSEEICNKFLVYTRYGLKFHDCICHCEERSDEAIY